jgi:hypothetical protein
MSALYFTVVDLTRMLRDRVIIVLGHWDGGNSKASVTHFP